MIQSCCRALIWKNFSHVRICGELYFYLLVCLQSSELRAFVATDYVKKSNHGKTWNAALDEQLVQFVNEICGAKVYFTFHKIGICLSQDLRNDCFVVQIGLRSHGN